MDTKPKLVILFSHHGAAWHVHVQGWPAPNVPWRLDDHGAFRVPAPNLEDLDDFMGKLEAPYAQNKTSFGGVNIEGSGSSAVALWEWLDRYLIPAQHPRG